MMTNSTVLTRLTDTVYKPSLIILLLFMVYISILAIATVTAVAGLRMEPSWVRASIPFLDIIGKLISQDNSEAYKLLDSLGIALIALIGANLFHRAKSPGARFENVVLVASLALAVLQLLLVRLLPNTETAADQLVDGDRLVIHLHSLLTRNANIAIALLSAAVGTKIIANNEGSGT
jgi:hypothetical protein